MRLKYLQTDSKSTPDEQYFADSKKQVWVLKNGNYVKPERYDIYAHICKINNMKSKTQIYNGY
jgi:hypothetical protein